MGIVNYVRNGRRFGDRKMLTGGQNQKNEPPGVLYGTKAAGMERSDRRKWRLGPHLGAETGM